MVSFTYVIKDKLGIHARPGLLLVQEAGGTVTNYNGEDICATEISDVVAGNGKIGWKNLFTLKC